MNQAELDGARQGSTPIKPDVDLGEVRAYREPAGNRFVVLADDSEATWKAYCAKVRERNKQTLPPECSICRRRHGLELIHACE